MSEPIKLPNMPFDLYHGIQDCDQYNAIRKYTTDAVEQATADLRKEFDSYENFSCQLVAALRKERDEAIHDHDTAQERIHEQFREIQSLLKECDEARAEVERLRAELSACAEERNNYSRILTALGMEEEGDPVAEVEALMQERDQLHEARAELTRLTTLRPIKTRKPEDAALFWEKSRNGQHWMLVDRREWHSHWTPLPDVKETK
jgi:DNA repair exonuclease SbcCD ATPase subunit